MNPNFEQYAKYYNLLYANKDYAAESAYILGLIKQYTPNSKTILDLGCGTGGHAFEWAKNGFDVTGIDISEDMLAAAHKRLDKDDLNNLRFESGDIRTARTGELYDVVTAMFHVMSYQTSNDDLLAAFETARAHVKDNGLFVFDFWYGPAVLSDPPHKRNLEIEDHAISVKRKTTPLMHFNRNVVDVNFDVFL